MAPSEGKLLTCMLEPLHSFVAVVVEWKIVRNVCLNVNRNKISHLSIIEQLSKHMYLVLFEERLMAVIPLWQVPS
jgi:hypothetical protein